MRIIAGRWGGRRIQGPPGRDTRPTTDRVREAWMSAAGSEIPGARVLDLFAGSGALGLEALSRGASHVTFVETAPAALRVLRANVELLGAAGEAEVLKTDAIRYASRLKPFTYHIAFADPPYGRGMAAELARQWAQRPFARLLCLEHRRDEDIGTDALRQKSYGDTMLTFLTADP